MRRKLMVRDRGWNTLVGLGVGPDDAPYVFNSCVSRPASIRRFVVERSDGSRVTGQLQGGRRAPRAFKCGANWSSGDRPKSNQSSVAIPDDGALLGTLAGIAAAAAYTKTVCGHDNPGCTANIALGLGGPLVLGGGVLAIRWIER
jgi:hypothetical protein